MMKGAGREWVLEFLPGYGGVGVLARFLVIRMQIQKSKISGSVLVARYRGCVTEINSWRAEETRWTTMFNRRNLLLSLLFPKVCSTNL